MHRFTLIFSLIVLVFFVSLALADIPRLINYQGMLTDDIGDPITDTLDLDFRIYNAPSNGILKWSETLTQVPVINGLFNVMLGTETDLELDFSEPYWLEVDVGGEIMSRLQFTSVGYAYRAKIADSATVAVSAPTGGGWTDDGVVIRLESGADSVGIGTTNPSAKLDVSGDANTSDSYKILGNRVLSISDEKNTFIGVEAGENNTESYGTFVGHRAGYNNEGAFNTFVGQGAGDDNTGGANTFVGQLAGAWNTTGGGNTFLGRRAGFYNTGGSYNTFLGSDAGLDNITGHFNIFIGKSAGVNCTTGTQSVYLGAEAGHSNFEGAGNVFIGYQAGYHETGSDKLYIANGQGTGDVLIYGDFSAPSVGIGTVSPDEILQIENSGDGERAFLQIETSHPSGWDEAGLRIRTPDHTWHLRMDDFSNNNLPDTGSLGLRSQVGGEVMTWTKNGNVGIGTTSPEEKLHVKAATEGVMKIGTPTANGDAVIIFEEGNDDALALRYDGSANELRIDDETTANTRMVIERSGKVGIGTMTPGAKLAVKGLTATSSYNWVKVNTATGDFYYSSSSKRYKEDIQPLEDDFDRILQVEPRSFIDKASEQREIGYVAEEFDEMGLGNLVIYDSEGQPDGLKYELVSLYLVEVVKDLVAENEEFKQRIEILEDR